MSGSSTFSMRRQARQQVEGLEDEADLLAAEPRQTVGRDRLHGPALEGDSSPALGCRRQPRISMSVVLPEPEGPVIATSSPGAIREIDAAERLDADPSARVGLGDGVRAR